MKILSNQKLIRRNQKIGQFTTLGSIGILVAGMVISFQPQYMNWSILCLLLGFTISQFGISYTNRFGRSPRPDEIVTNSLKGLGDQYTLYHYLTPVAHLLVGPAGIWTILPYQQRGSINYDANKNRWVQKGGNLYLKVFAQEGLGRPDQDIRIARMDMEKYFQTNAGDVQLPPVQAALLFTNPKAEVDASDAPTPTLTADKLKDLIRRKGKEEPISMEQVRLLQKMLPQESNE